MTTKKEIIEHLEKKGNYESSVDDFIVNILVTNLKFAQELKEDILKNGAIVTIPNGNGIATTKENPALGSYAKVLKNIFQCTVKLGISRKERIALKLLEENIPDDFDKEFFD